MVGLCGCLLMCFVFCLGSIFGMMLVNFRLQNGTKIGHPGGILGRSWARLGGVLGSLGGLLGASWGVLGASWGGLGGVLGALGGQDANMVRGIGFCRPILGPKMAPLGASLGHLAFQDGAKVDKKSIPKSIKKTMPLGIDFLDDFGRSWGGKMGPSWH